MQGAGLLCPCRYDGLNLSEVDPQLEELLGLVVWLTTCGRSELKVFDSVTYPQLEGFKFHDEASGGSSCVPGAWQQWALRPHTATQVSPQFFTKKQTVGTCQGHSRARHALGEIACGFRSLSFIGLSSCVGWDLE